MKYGVTKFGQPHAYDGANKHARLAKLWDVVNTLDFLNSDVDFVDFDMDFGVWLFSL